MGLVNHRSTKGVRVGQATDITDRIISKPLTAQEVAERQSGEKVRENVEATPDGEIAERATPAAAPRTTFQAAPSTWD